MEKESFHKKALIQSRDVMSGLSGIINQGQSKNIKHIAKITAKRIKKRPYFKQSKDGDSKEEKQWILARGRWVDDGIWIDTETWND